MARQFCALWIILGAGCVFVPSDANDACEDGADCSMPMGMVESLEDPSDSAGSTVSTLTVDADEDAGRSNAPLPAPPPSDSDALVDQFVSDVLFDDQPMSTISDPLGIPLSGVDATPDPILFLFNSLAFNRPALDRPGGGRVGSSQAFLERLCIAIGEPDHRCRQRFGE